MPATRRHSVSRSSCKENKIKAVGRAREGRQAARQCGDRSGTEDAEVEETLYAAKMFGLGPRHDTYQSTVQRYSICSSALLIVHVMPLPRPGIRSAVGVGAETMYLQHRHRRDFNSKMRIINSLLLLLLMNNTYVREYRVNVNGMETSF